VGDVLYVDQPAAQQMLVSLYGNTLLTPTNPPHNAELQTPLPPDIAVTTTTSTTTTTLKSSTTKKAPPTTTTTNASQVIPPYDPVPCNP
jgi:hypothetical protein